MGQQGSQPTADDGELKAPRNYVHADWFDKVAKECDGLKARIAELEAAINAVVHIDAGGPPWSHDLIPISRDRLEALAELTKGDRKAASDTETQRQIDGVWWEKVRFVP